MTADTPIQRVDVLGVGISVVDLDTAVDHITTWVEENRRTYVCVTGVHGVMESQRDPRLLEIHNRSGLTTADGMPMVWAGRYAGVRTMQRVYGPELMLRVCERAAERGWTSFFYGGAAGVPELLSERLRNRYPALRVAGTYSPPFRPLDPEEDAREVETINAARPDILWVGISTPKQERWMANHLGRIEAKIMLGVGAAFDINAGLRRSAPRPLQTFGLEWLFRLANEPRRLWRRYLRNNPAFIWEVLRRRPFLRETDLPYGYDSHRLEGRSGATTRSPRFRKARRNTLA